MNALDLTDRRQRHPLPARRSRRGAFAASGILARSIGPKQKWLIGIVEIGDVTLFVLAPL